MALLPLLQAGSRFGKLCFSHDSRFLFCCCGSVVKVFNTTNGECVHDLQAHSKGVTGVYLNPSNVLQIITCGQDGYLIFWDYLDGVKLKEHDLHLPLYGIISVNADIKSMMIIAETSSSRRTFSLVQWKRIKANPDEISKPKINEFSKPKILIEGCTGDYGLISFGCSRDFVASGSGHILTIYSMKKETTKLVQDIANKKRAITCVACHPTEYVIATGLDNGKIILWHNFFNDNQPVISRLHWHALPVLCLEFTPDGSNLLSGGHECVLVKWQMGNTNQKDFKPRMGAPLTKVLCSPDGSYYATEHSDNVVQLLNINLKILQVYRGLTRGNMGFNSNNNPIPCGLQYDPRSQALVTNGCPGHLQFYSLVLNRQLYNLDIVGQNYISSETIERPKVITEITAAALNGNGEWLATFELWDDGHFNPEMRLKFWSWSSEAQTYSLNTTVETPHDGPIVKMVFRPVSSQSDVNCPTLVTCGSDHCFKSWILVDDADIYRQNMRWDCDSVGFYRSMSVTCADFSQDGSSLAVGFEHLITLWDPDNNVVQKTLSNCLPDRQPITHILFGSGDCSHLLVVAVKRALIVWDLTTLEILWKLEMDISVLFKDPVSELMAFISKSSLSVFTPNSSSVIYQHQKISSTEILDALFIPNGRNKSIAGSGWPGTSQIYMFSADEELITLDCPQHKQDGTNQVKIAQNLPESAMNVFLAEKMVREKQEVNEKTLLKVHKKADDNYMSQLLYSNEPVSNICNQFLKTLLLKSCKASSIHGTTDSLEDSSDSEMETEEKEYSKQETSLPPAEAKREELDMNKLLSPSLDWIQWCSSLKLE